MKVSPCAVVSDRPLGSAGACERTFDTSLGFLRMPMSGSGRSEVMATSRSSLPRKSTAQPSDCRIHQCGGARTGCWSAPRLLAATRPLTAARELLTLMSSIRPPSISCNGPVSTPALGCPPLFAAPVARSGSGARCAQGEVRRVRPTTVFGPWLRRRPNLRERAADDAGSEGSLEELSLG